MARSSPLVSLSVRGLRLSALAAVLAGSSLVMGCKDCNGKPAENGVDAAPATASAAPASSSAATADDAMAPDGLATANADDRGRRGMQRGPNTMLFQAARELELSSDQKTKVDAADKLGFAEGDPTKDAAKELHTELIAGIKAGKIDTAKIEPRYVAIEKLAVAEHDKEAASLDALHAALDPLQRKATVAIVRAKQAKREERMAMKEKEKGDAGAPDAGKAHAGRGHIDRLVRGLDLDADQQKKIEALAPKDDIKGGKPDAAEMKRRLEALLSAFEKDTFDAKKVEAFDVKRNRGALEEETKLLSQIVPILKPEQRERLAAKMDKGGSPHAPRRSGYGHRPLVEQEEDDWSP